MAIKFQFINLTKKNYARARSFLRNGHQIKDYLLFVIYLRRIRAQ